MTQQTGHSGHGWKTGAAGRDMTMADHAFFVLDVRVVYKQQLIQ